MLRFFTFLTLFAIVASKNSTRFKVVEFQGYRLPDNTRPIRYDIHLITKVHEDETSYSGVVTITLKALENTSQIVLHADETIEILKLSLIDHNEGAEFQNMNYTRHERNDFLTIFSAPEPLQLKTGNEYTLTLSFKASHENYRIGFYRWRYFDNTGQSVWIASTFFEPFYARMAFPCYDEPMLKAKFSIVITHSANYTALSNMPLDGKPIRREDGLLTTKFKQTPIMSTYLLAFVIGNYDSTSQEIIDNITHRVFSQPTDKFKGEFALNISTNILHFYEDYFGIKYYLPKLDHISIPLLESGSGMENLGLITYDTEALLPYPQSSKLDNFQTGFLIAHEIAHHWLGNLVTPMWWNYVWLKEGTSNFYSIKFLETLRPKWEATKYYYFVTCGDYWNTPEPQPMTYYYDNKIDNMDKFDDIFYYKGSLIVRMFEHALTNTTFKKGVSNFLMKHQYSSVEESDFFESLQEVAKEDNIPVFEEKGMVNEIMSSWTKQNYYPMITVARYYKNGSFLVEQNTMYHADDNSSTGDQLWWIPVTFATASEPDFDDTMTNFVFPARSNITVYPSALNITLKENDWLILNKQQIGIYRVNYDENNWILITNALKRDPKSIHAYNKVQLIRDAEFAESNSLLSHNILFGLLSYLENEDDILPWVEAIKVLENIFQRLPANDGHYFKYFTKNIIRKIYNNIGTNHLPTDTVMVEAFRTRLLDFVQDMQLKL